MTGQAWKLLVAYDTQDVWLIVEVPSLEAGIHRRDRQLQTTKRPVKWTAIVRT